MYQYSIEINQSKVAVSATLIVFFDVFLTQGGFLVNSTLFCLQSSLHI